MELAVVLVLFEMYLFFSQMYYQAKEVHKKHCLEIAPATVTIHGMVLFNMALIAFKVLVLLSLALGMGLYDLVFMIMIMSVLRSVGLSSYHYHHYYYLLRIQLPIPADLDNRNISVGNVDQQLIIPYKLLGNNSNAQLANYCSQSLLISGNNSSARPITVPNLNI